MFLYIIDMEVFKIFETAHVIDYRDSYDLATGHFSRSISGLFVFSIRFCFKAGSKTLVNSSIMNYPEAEPSRYQNNLS